MRGAVWPVTCTLATVVVSLACAGTPVLPTCAEGEAWVPAKESCVCLEPDVCGPKPTAPQCVGTWTGSLTDNLSKYTGQAELTITAPTEPSLDDPTGGKCGILREQWTDGGRCTIYLGTCTIKAKIVAVGWPTDLSDCDRGALELDCASGTYQRIDDDYRVKGVLSRGD